MTRDEAIAATEKAYPSEFLDFGCGRSDNRAQCELLVDRLTYLGVITPSDSPVALLPQVDSGREKIARIIDPVTFELLKNPELQNNPNLISERDRAFIKADAILALRPERSGGRGA